MQSLQRPSECFSRRRWLKPSRCSPMASYLTPFPSPPPGQQWIWRLAVCTLRLVCSSEGAEWPCAPGILFALTCLEMPSRTDAWGPPLSHLTQEDGKVAVQRGVSLKHRKVNKGAHCCPGKKVAVGTNRRLRPGRKAVEWTALGCKGFGKLPRVLRNLEGHAHTQGRVHAQKDLRRP